MKTVTKILAILLIAVLAACEGPEGRPGMDGLPGEDGDALVGTIFETTVDFTEENEYSAMYYFPANFEIYTTDIVMVYLLWGQESGTGNDVWRPLPQTIFLNEGVIQYNFDYTVESVQIFVDETVGGLVPAEAENQTFRIAVLPAADYLSGNYDLQDLNSVMKSFNIEEDSVHKFPSVK